MNDSSNDGNTFLYSGLIIFGLFAFGILKFSNVINVDFSTGLQVLVFLGLIIGATYFILKKEIVSHGLLWPGFISVIVGVCVIPIFENWADARPLYFTKPAWYVQWYWELAFVLLPSLVGYGVRYVFRR